METKVKYANGNFANLFLYESKMLISGMDYPSDHGFGGSTANLVPFSTVNRAARIECKMFER